MKVLSEREDVHQVTNSAKVVSSEYLIRAVYQREAVVRYDKVQRAAIVLLHVDSIDHRLELERRPGLHGGRELKQVRDRAIEWWGLLAAQSRRERLIEPDGTLPGDVD